MIGINNKTVKPVSPKPIGTTAPRRLEGAVERADARWRRVLHQPSAQAERYANMTFDKFEQMRQEQGFQQTLKFIAENENLPRK